MICPTGTQVLTVAKSVLGKCRLVNRTRVVEKRKAQLEESKDLLELAGSYLESF